MESMTRNVTDFGRWVTDKSFRTLQSLNSNSEAAQERLKTNGSKVLGQLKAEGEASAADIKNLVLEIMQPMQTLEVTAKVGVGFFFVVRKVMPWPISWTGMPGVALCGYSTFQMMKANEAAYEEFFFFEKRGVEKISRDEFVRHADNMADRILAKCSLFRVITSNEHTRSFRDIGEMVNQMIDSSDSPEALQKMISEVSMFRTLFQLARQVEDRHL